MCFINNQQADIIQVKNFISEPVVQCFHHGYKTHVVVRYGEFFHRTVDDFILYAEFIQHLRSLSAEFYAMGENEYFFSGQFNIAAGDFRKDHGFTSSCGELVKQIVAGRMIFQPFHDFVDCTKLIVIQLLPESFRVIFFIFQYLVQSKPSAKIRHISATLIEIVFILLQFYVP